jgi:hypothetical protein
MLLEHLLALPVGTQVLGDLDVATSVPGVVQSHQDGSHFIQWMDGFVSVPFGQIRDYDEYIAAHTELKPNQFECFQFKTVRKKVEAAAPSVCSDTNWMRSA